VRKDGGADAMNGSGAACAAIPSPAGAAAPLQSHM